MLRALYQMNREAKELTFHDHLAALHAFSRVAHLMEMQQKMFPPLENLNASASELKNHMFEYIEKQVAQYEQNGKPVPEWLQDVQNVLLERDE